MLIRPHVLEHDDKTVFFYRNDIHKPYIQTYQRLLGQNAVTNSPISFVTHYMYFNKSRVMELKKLIEAKHNTDWYTAILNCINTKELSSFAEYETYGNFIYEYYPGQMILKEWLNLSLKRSSIKNISSINIKKLADRYRSISFHSLNQ